MSMNAARSMTLRLVLLCGVLLLAGCSPTAEPKGIWGKLWKVEVGPDYKRPEVAPVEEFRSQLGFSEQASLADLPWWSVFKDQALQQLIAEALARHFNQSAQALVRHRELV